MENVESDCKMYIRIWKMLNQAVIMYIQVQKMLNQAV